MKSDVYLVRTGNSGPGTRRDALLKLLNNIRLFPDCRKDEIIPVKITIGDTKCVYNLSPEIVKLVINDLKRKKTKPFLFDTNVIYKGARLNAVDHLTLAQNKGFSHSKAGAPFIIADGLFGQDGKEYALDSEYIKNIKLPSFIGMLDKLLVLSHVTCHILSGYAGSIKNVSMGMACRPTKQAQHSSLKPHVIIDKCTSCGCCVKICPAEAIALAEKACIDQSKCIGCGECLCACKFDSIFVNWGEDVHIFSKRMAETAGFILSKFKDRFFVNFAFDMTKECDCISTKNEKIIREDIGILASKDILALDRATVDLINETEDVLAREGMKDSYKTLFEHAHKKGLGNTCYNLIIL
ncbi:MAG: DUF362 domain-containing protein [Candidatus Omnitrophica bacterium]|nr:DUF362 domain-containing protein [Candidatus Omnitrophota bacterium]MBU1932631.1 DUF362 domain-containing protein [Candidatus Omnitrophota bacterium]